MPYVRVSGPDEPRCGSPFNGAHSGALGEVKGRQETAKLPRGWWGYRNTRNILKGD